MNESHHTRITTLHIFAFSHSVYKVNFWLEVYVTYNKLYIFEVYSSMSIGGYIYTCVTPFYTQDMEYFHQARVFLIAHLLKEATDLLTVTTD